MKPGGEVIEVNFEELEALVERARQGPLQEQDYQKLQAAIHALSHLIELIGERQMNLYLRTVCILQLDRARGRSRRKRRRARSIVEKTVLVLRAIISLPSWPGRATD